MNQDPSVNHLRSKRIPCYMRTEEEGRHLLRCFVEDEELYVKMYKTRDLKHMVRKWIHPERYFHYMRENQTRKRSDLPPIDMSWLNKHVMREAYVNREAFAPPTY